MLRRAQTFLTKIDKSQERKSSEFIDIVIYGMAPNN